MKDFSYLVGTRFGKLIVIETLRIFIKSKEYPVCHAICICDCGKKTKPLPIGSLTCNLTKSCGCLYKEFTDLTNKRYGDLLVLKRTEKRSGNGIHYLCRCLCGNEVVRSYIGLNAGKATHCGCKIKKVKYLNRTLYEVWKGMKARCRDKNHASYRNYGGKGVTVCDEWRSDFKSFYKWAMENGYKKGLQIDKDIKGNGLLYSPEMCCFVTRTDNMRASHHTKMNLEKVGIIRESKKSVLELSKFFNVHTTTVRSILLNKTWKTI